MEQRTEENLSPYRTFSRAAWAALREDAPMTLTVEEVTRLRSLHDRLDIHEVEDIYLTLSRLLYLYVAATQRLFRAQERFLGTEDVKMPYIIGVAGSVAVGKSTTARVLQALLARWPNVPKVDLITTDGFLFPNAVLEREGLMEKKGFPESYDLSALLRLVQPLRRRHIDRQQPRQRQIDILDLFHVEPVVQRAQPVDLVRGQRHRHVLAQRRPFGPRVGAVGRQAVVGALFHAEVHSCGREAFSSRPDFLVRVSSSASTSASVTPRACSITSRW